MGGLMRALILISKLNALLTVKLRCRLYFPQLVPNLPE